MTDFASALAESFAVAPARTTGLLIDTFDSAGRYDDPVRPSVSPCFKHEAARASICRAPAASGTCRTSAAASGTCRAPASCGGTCRVPSTVA